MGDLVQPGLTVLNMLEQSLYVFVQIRNLLQDLEVTDKSRSEMTKFEML